MELNAENIINEIQSLIKALKDCGGWVKRGNGEGWFNHEILADALSVINSQEQKIKELTEELEKERTWADSLIDNLRDDIRELTTENVQFRHEQRKLTEENERLRADNEIKSQKRANIFEIANAFERGRTDGVRKMHSMLCEGRVSNDTVVIVANQVAKEMLGVD